MVMFGPSGRPKFSNTKKNTRPTGSSTHWDQTKRKYGSKVREEGRRDYQNHQHEKESAKVTEKNKDKENENKMRKIMRKTMRKTKRQIEGERDN